MDVKKAEWWRIDAFELWRWIRLLRVPWTARRSNQSILKEISPKYALEGLMLKLKLQYLNTWCKELTFWKRPWCWEKLKVGEEGDDRGWDGWMASLNQLTESMDMSLSKLEVGDGQGGLACYSPWGREESDTTERLHFHFSLSCIEEGNGNPLQCCCLENPRDGGAWWLPSMGSQRVRHDWAIELNWTELKAKKKPTSLKEQSLWQNSQLGGWQAQALGFTDSVWGPHDFISMLSSLLGLTVAWFPFSLE